MSKKELIFVVCVFLLSCTVIIYLSVKLASSVVDPVQKTRCKDGLMQYKVESNNGDYWATFNFITCEE